MAAEEAEVDAGREPSGKQRSPFLVVVLGLVTLGLYPLYWIWAVSKEMDRFDPHRDSPYDVVKWALALFVAGVAGFAGGWGSLFAGAAGAEAGLGAGVILFGLGAVLLVLGGLAIVFAHWRLWKGVEAHERAIDAPTALSPGMMLVLLLVPLLNLIGIIYIPYRTQEGLNRIWAAAEEGYQPSPRPSGSLDQETDRDAEAEPSGETV